MKIYVGNIPHSLRDEELSQHFQTYGQVASAAVLKDKFTGESRGFGFVEMTAKAEAEAAIAGLNGKPLNGRTLTVNEARPKTESSFGSAPRGDRGDRTSRSGSPPRRSW